MNSQLLLAAILGLTAFGVGAGARWGCRDADPPTAAAGHFPVGTVGRAADRRAPKRDPALLETSPPPPVQDLLALDRTARIQAVIEHLPSLESAQLRELATYLRSGPGQDEDVLAFLVFTRWGEVDSEAALTFLYEFPHWKLRNYVASGRAAVDLRDATRRPLTGERRAGLELLLEQLPPELALRIARRCLDPDEKLLAILAKAADEAQDASLGELGQWDPARWARRLAATTPAGAWESNWAREQEILALATAWGRTDPEAAMAWIMKETTGDLQSRAMQMVNLETTLSHIDPEHDPKGALDALTAVLKASSGFPELHPPFYLKIIRDWLKTDQSAALAWLHRNGTSDLFEKIPLPGTLDDGLRIVAGLPVGALHRTLSRRLTERWAAERPEEAFAWLRANKLSPEEAAELSLETADPFGDPFDREEPEDIPNSADPFYVARLHDERLSELFKAALDRDLDSAMVAAANSGKAEWIDAVVEARTLHDPRETVAWLSALDADWVNVSAGWQAAFQTWIRESPAEASTWVAELPDSPRRDLGISAVLYDLTTDGPAQDYAAAFKWAGVASERPWVDPVRPQLADGSLPTRTLFLSSVLESWAFDLETDAERAEARAAFHEIADSLDDQTRSELEGLLNSPDGDFPP